MLTELCLISLLLFHSFTTPVEKKDNRNYSFEVDYENDQFLLDGQPFQFVAGSFHYFRAPKQYWKNILRKMRAAGLNTVTTYIEWSTHEPEPNKWVWDGNANITKFIKTAEEENLFVILRPGPYICAERDFGGFPYWLLSLVPDIKLRTKDERYVFFAERYLNEILKRIKPLLRGNGGPIIMVQIENEYGSLDICDKEYKRKLHEIFNRHVGRDAVLFTVDGMTRKILKCGKIPGVYGTIDFAPSQNLKKNFKMMREISPKYLPLPNLKVPSINLKRNYGIISMVPVLDLFAEESRFVFGTSKNEFTEPPTFEALRLPYWLVLYEADLTRYRTSQCFNLTATVKDRALVYVNDKLSGTLTRQSRNYALSLSIDEITSIKLLVENQGRVNYGKLDIQDFKGVSNVKLNNIKVSPWNVTGFKLASITDEYFSVRKTNKQTGKLYNSPQFLVGYFEIEDEPLDTFLNTQNWGKGVAYVNGQNLGRYWPLVGPQITLYVPAPFLKKGTNCLVLLELESIPDNRIIKFQATPLFIYKHYKKH